jgi:FixJ family two-component response regulator
MQPPSDNDRLTRRTALLKTRVEDLEAQRDALAGGIAHECNNILGIILGNTEMAMPGMSGDRLVGEILKLNPDLPVILCSGFSEKIDEERAHAIGAQLYLEKPVDMATLARSVRRALQK